MLQIKDVLAIIFVGWELIRITHRVQRTRMGKRLPLDLAHVNLMTIKVSKVAKSLRPFVTKLPLSNRDSPRAPSPPFQSTMRGRFFNVRITKQKIRLPSSRLDK